jgi:hypothetical protein
VAQNRDRLSPLFVVSAASGTILISVRNSGTEKKHISEFQYDNDGVLITN